MRFVFIFVGFFFGGVGCCFCLHDFGFAYCGFPHSVHAYVINVVTDTRKIRAYPGGRGIRFLEKGNILVSSDLQNQKSGTTVGGYIIRYYFPTAVKNKTTCNSLPQSTTCRNY